jgi:hypothetical protein
MHTAILYQPMIAATDLAGNININTSAQVFIFNADGSPLGQAMYATPNGVTPIVNPILPNNAGYLEVYVDTPQAVMLTVSGQSSKAAFSSWPEVPFAYEDVRVHGASTSASSSYNQGAIQEAVAAVIGRGGGIVLLPERYHISGSPIEVSTNANTLTTVTFQGAGRYSSGLIQDTAGKDVLCFGRSGGVPRSDIGSAYGCGARDLSLIGGANGLRLNNAIVGSWKRLYFDANATGLRTEGQCENHWFEDLDFAEQSSYGIYVGSDNGIAAANQEIQKCTFKKIRMHGIAPNAVNAIRVDGGLGATGNIEFDHVTLEDGPGNWINCTGNISTVKFRRLTVEESSVALTNTGARGAVPSGGWRVITQGAGCSRLDLIDCPLLTPTDNAALGLNRYGYVLDQQNGITYINNCVFIGFGGGLATNAAINLQSGGALMIGGAVGDHTQVLTTTTSAKAGTMLIGVRDSLNVVITNWDDNGPIAYLSSAQLGLVMGQRTFGDTQNAQDRAYHQNIAAGDVVDLGTQNGRFVLFDPPTGKQASFTTNGVAHTVNELSDPDAVLVVNATAAVAEPWRVSWNGSSFILTNLSGAPRLASWQRLDFNS